MTNNSWYEKWKQYQYYVLIGVLSLFALFFLPMIGSEAGLAFLFPNTAAGWVVYITSKLIVAGLNFMILHCFVQQGKVNILNNERYLTATDILRTATKSKDYTPRSPEIYLRGVYGKKGATLFATSLLSAIGLTQAILTFDLMSMLTYLFTVIMGVICGILQMNQTETYWTEEYYQYALYIQKQEEENKRIAAEKAKQDQVIANQNVAMDESPLADEGNDTTDDIGGTDLLVSPDSNGPSCDNN